MANAAPSPYSNTRSDRHDALVDDIAKRVQAIGQLIAKTKELHRSDQCKELEALRKKLEIEVSQLEHASDQAWELSS